MNILKALMITTVLVLTGCGSHDKPYKYEDYSNGGCEYSDTCGAPASQGGTP